MLYYTTELSHHGVKGMKWGVRKDPEKYISRTAKRVYKLEGSNSARSRKRGAKLEEKLEEYVHTNRTPAKDAALKRAVEQEQNRDKKSMSTAKKVAIGIGVAAAIGVTAYGIHKGRKIAIDSLSKDAINKGKSYVAAGMKGKESAAHIMNNADKAKLRGSFETMKFQESLAKNTSKSAEKYMNEGLDLIKKGQDRSFSNKEVFNEMKRMGSERLGLSKRDYSKYRAPGSLTGYSKRGNAAQASFNKAKFYGRKYKETPISRAKDRYGILRDIYNHEEAHPIYTWKTYSGAPRKLRKR